MQTTLQIGGKPIRLDMYEPQSTPRSPAILFLHGAGGNAEFWVDRLTPLIARAGVAVYALHYFDRTGTIRADLPTLTDGVHVPLWLQTIQQALQHIAQRPAVDPARIALVGVSLGGFLSLALPTLPGTASIKAVVEVSGGLVAPYAQNATPAFPPTLIVHGDADTVVAPSHAHALDERLNQLKVPHQMHILRGETHWFTALAQTRILAAIAGFLGHHLAPGAPPSRS